MTDRRDLLAPGVSPAVAYLAGYSGTSLTAIAASLRVIAGLALDTDPAQADPTKVPWGQLERAHVKRIREMLSERYAPATAKRHFSALCGMLKECGRGSVLDGIRGPKGSSAETGRALSFTEICALLNACPLTFRGSSLRALVAVSYSAGLRRFETTALDLGDFDRETGVLTIRKGKGRKARAIMLAPRARGALTAWIETRGGEPGPLFFGRTPPTRISYSTVEYRLKRLASAAGVAAFTSHDLRRTFVTRILEKTHDLGIAQRLAGHSSPTTTARYDKRDRAVLDAASIAIDD